MDELDPEKPTVLLVGSIDTEGVLSALKTANRQYVSKRLESKPANWQRIGEIINSLPIESILVKLSQRSIRLLLLDEYEAVRDELLKRIVSCPHAVFAHEAIVSDEPEAELMERDQHEDDFYPIYTPLPLTVRREARALLAGYGIEIVPYERNAELTTLAASFVADAREGLLFRVYVPAGRLWANETDRLIQLFRDYLSRVGHYTVRLDQRRTQRGIVFELYSTDSALQGEGIVPLAMHFEEFSKFLDVVVSEPEEAEKILRNRDVDPREVTEILTRYAKEAKRLQLDLRHEREQKLLGIRQRLEGELVDVLPAHMSFNSIEDLIQIAVPQVGTGSAVLTAHQQLLPAPGAPGGLTVNISPQIVNAVNAVVAQEITGDISLSEVDHRILQLIDQYGGERKAQLSSDVRELADESAPHPGRLRARQRLKGFLWQAASKVPDLGVGLLQDYLSGRLGLS